MAGKRANGEGTIYPLKDKEGKVTGYRAAISYYIGTELRREQRRCRKRSDAAIALQELRADKNRLVSASIAKKQRKSKAASLVETEATDSGEFIEPSVTLLPDPTIENFVTWWLQKIIRPNRADNTFMSYKTSVKQICRYMGTCRLATLSAVHILDFLAAMEEGGMQPPSRRLAFEVLNRALNQAVKPLFLLRENPCGGIQRPPTSPKKIDPFTEEEVAAIMRELQGTPYHAPVILAMMCGLRQGEIAGLQPEDIDWKNRRIKISRQVTRKEVRKTKGYTGPSIVFNLNPTKSKAGTRDVPLPGLVISALKDYLAIRMAAGHAGAQQLFPGPGGGLMNPAKLNHGAWVSTLRTLKMRHRGFHHCRHTYATTSLSKGVAIAVVSKTMGHASQTITLSTYSHWMPSEEFQAADLMDRLFA